jgi:hypothetical protein
MLTTERAEIEGLREYIRKLEQDVRLANDATADWRSRANELIGAREADGIIIARLRAQIGNNSLLARAVAARGAAGR